MDKNRAVELYRPQQRYFGTGYLVTPELVLTALHTFTGNISTIPSNRSCEVRLFGDVQQNRETWRIGRLVWPSDAEWSQSYALDIGLVEITSDTSSRDFCQAPLLWGLADEERYESLDCRALGFPCGREFDGNKREIWEARGLANVNSGSRECVYFLSLSQATDPDASRRQFVKPEDWHGYSGAAIFTRDRHGQFHLVGVVLSSPKDDQYLKARRISKPLLFKSFQALVNAKPSSPEATETDRPGLRNLVCLVDRAPQENACKIALQHLLAKPLRPPVVCLVGGERKHIHYALAQRFAADTLLRLPKNSAGSGGIRPLAWPPQINGPVKWQLASLRQQLSVLLNFGTDQNDLEALSDAAPMTRKQAARWRQQFGHCLAPSVYYSELRAESWNTAQRSLFEEWVRFLGQISTPGLEYLRVHVLALVWEDHSGHMGAPSPLAAWMGKIPPLTVGRVHILRTNDLADCLWLELDEWLVQHVWRLRPDLKVLEDQIRRHLDEDLQIAPFTLDALLKAVNKLQQ